MAGRSRVSVFLPLGFFVLLIAARADDRNPLANRPGAAKAGEYEFRINCAMCHGLGAHGGGRGPDLTRAKKKHATTDADLFQVISNGITGTAMPANGIGGQGVGMTDDEIWEIIAYIRSQEVKPSVSSANPVHGKELFFGDADCSSCHMVHGQGGRLGPDLTSVASSRTHDAIIESVREPSRRLAWGLQESSKEFAQEYETITVVTAEGRKVRGVAFNEDQFSVQLMDMGGHLHLLEKDKLQSFSKTRESMMPPADEQTLSRSDLEDIIAYLASLEAK